MGAHVHGITAYVVIIFVKWSYGCHNIIMLNFISVNQITMKSKNITIA